MRTAIAAFLFIFNTSPADAETFRIATFNTELSQKGPGLLLRALEQKSLPQAEAVLDVVRTIKPDILLLQNIDWDAEGRTLGVLTQRLSAHGLQFEHGFTIQPNSGRRTTLDLDGDGRTGGPGDAQGYGAFTGAHGMVILSRFPIANEQIEDHSGHLWKDLPWAHLPTHADGSPFPSVEAQEIQRLSSTNHFTLPIDISDRRQIKLMVFHATPPVFDGEEDRNGKRNHDEIAFWAHVLDAEEPEAPVILIGDANLDPQKGDGRHAAIQRLLSHPRLQDPEPASETGGTATVNWSQTGPLRVDYILPDRLLRVVAAGVHWPSSPTSAAAMASRHRLVWLDIEVPD